MATKLIPGPRDGYARALPDEPLFTLLARDPVAPFLVSIWSSVRNGDIEAAGAKFRKMLETVTVPYLDTPEPGAASEALDCALAMFAWRPANDGRWREPVTAPPYTGLSGTGRLIAIAADGCAVLERDGEPEQRFVYRGLRFAHLGPDPRDPRRVILQVLGGAGDPPDDEVEAVVASVSLDGLDAFATDVAVAAARAKLEAALADAGVASERVR